MELRQLRFFETVARHLHFGRAAEELFVTQPPLSQQIIRLEHELGLRLFTRTSRRVELTSAGEALLEPARRVLAEVEHLEHTARRLTEGRAGLLKIGFAFSALNWGLAQHLHRFHIDNPDVTLDVTQMTVAAQETALAENEIDVGFTVGQINAEHVTVTPLAVEPLMAVLPANHHLADRDSIDLNEIAGENFVGFSTTHVHDYITRACGLAGFSPRVTLQGPQVHTMIHLVVAGLGVTLAPRCDCRSLVPGAVFKQLSPVRPTVEISAIRHRWRDDAVASALVEDIQAHPGEWVSESMAR
jgi:DNA-binding transcriptional LysR family regulator